MDNLKLGSLEYTSPISSAIEQRKQPLGEPRRIVAVFYRDKSLLVKVNMVCDYERAPYWRVHEYLPHTFSVGEFRRRFPQSEDESSIRTGLNDGKVCSPISQQPRLLYRTSTGQSSPRVVTVERANICIPPAAASNVSIPSHSTNLPSVADHIAQPNSYIPHSLLRPTLVESASAYGLPFEIYADTSILAGDSILWIESLELCPGVGVRAQKVLVRRDQKCRFILGCISLEKLCSGREGNIEAVVGTLNYFAAWKFHRSESNSQLLTYTGPPIEQVVVAALHRQISPRRGENS
ncbi:hypothetical protein EJ07DRAFT_152618 [Lizonia empirigonia]|nr:hypothetical protein EJ07DRAFT_152618 [Lizonia empirigonia]